MQKDDTPARICILFAFALTISFTSCESGSSPRSNRIEDVDPAVGQIILPPYVYDSDTPYLTATIPFQNTTGSPVAFATTRSNCCCIEVKTDRLEAAPGETITATALFNLRGRPSGRHRFTVALEKENRETWGRDILVEIVRLAQWSKEQVHLGTICKNSSAVSRVTYQICKRKRDDIDPRMQFSASVPAVSAENTRCDIRHRPEIGFWVATYDVTLRAHFGDGVENSAARVEPSEAMPDGSHQLFLTWSFRPPIIIEPTTVFLTAQASRDPMRVTLSRPDGSPFKIQEIRGDPSGQVEATFDADARNQHVVELRLKIVPNVAVSDGRLTVITSHPDAPTITVRYSVFVPDLESIPNP